MDTVQFTVGHCTSVLPSLTQVFNVIFIVTLALKTRNPVTGAADDLFKQRTGHQVEKVAENAGYLRQGWGPRGVESILAGSVSLP